jgi:hypothetical protein
MALSDNKACEPRSLSLAVGLALALASLTVMAAGPAKAPPKKLAQAPVPGSGSAGATGSALGSSTSLPTPASAPAPPPPLLAPALRGASEKLPLNQGNAQARLEELRSQAGTMRPLEYQEALNQYYQWVADLADAHWKLAQTFAKNEATKAQSASEKQLCQKFGGLKRQAMLLKAQFLISQRRYPEALPPLVDIVNAEPRTATGQAAYKLLQDIGFSQQAADAPEGASTSGATGHKSPTALHTGANSHRRGDPMGGPL